jgi:hypothetical protein
MAFSRAIVLGDPFALVARGSAAIRLGHSRLGKVQRSQQAKGAKPSKAFTVPIMRRDTCLKIGLVAGTACAGGLLLWFQGMTFSLWHNAAPVWVMAALAPAAALSHRRQNPQFVMTLLALMTLLVFTSCFTVLMYALAALSFPLTDPWLVAADAFFGVHVPSIVDWAGRHPWIAGVLEVAYATSILQTFALVIALGFTGQRRSLENFVLRFMVALLITAVVFALVPAEGPFTGYGFEPSPHQADYLEHLRTLRSGERTEVVLVGAEGLVTFPSFHTAWAILLTAAVWHRRRWLPIVAIVNSLVIAATLTTGWHYFVDVLGGAAVAYLAIEISRRLESRRYGKTSGRNEFTTPHPAFSAAIPLRGRGRG